MQKNITKVICKNNKRASNAKLLVPLTINKIYSIVHSSKEFITIKNDKGQNTPYRRCRFAPAPDEVLDGQTSIYDYL